MSVQSKEKPLTFTRTRQAHTYIHRHGLRYYSHSPGKIDLDGFINLSSQLTYSSLLTSICASASIKSETHPKQNKTKIIIIKETPPLSHAVSIMHLQTMQRMMPPVSVWSLWILSLEETGFLHKNDKYLYAEGQEVLAFNSLCELG